MEDKKVFITGVNGFTGPYVKDQFLAGGYRVYGTGSNKTDGLEEVYDVDLCDGEALTGVVKEIEPDAVVHLAAIAFVDHGSADDIYKTNILGTRNLLHSLSVLNKKPEKILLASSANIYGNSEVEEINENVVASPQNDYAVSKYAMEMMARLWMDSLPIVIARPFNYTGVGQSPKFLIPKIVSHFSRKEKVIELGNINVSRDFSDVRSTAIAYKKLIDAASPGEIYNVCSGVDHSLQQVVDMLSTIAGYEIEVTVNPDFVRENEVKRLLGDGSKLSSLVGQADKIPLYNTLQWMYEDETSA